MPNPKAREMFSPAVAVYLGLVGFSLLGSAYSHQSHFDPTPIGRPTALLTLGAGISAGIVLNLGVSRKLMLGLGSVLLLGGFAEWVGITTGFPFGRYAYTEAWWPTLLLPGNHRFPVQLPFAWLLVSGSSSVIVGNLKWPQAVISSALIATGVDQLMEPVMTGPLHYWRWIDHGPLAANTPASNAIGWFLISVLGAIGFYAASPSIDPRHSRNALWVMGGHITLALGIGLLASY